MMKIHNGLSESDSLYFYGCNTAYLNEKILEWDKKTNPFKVWNKSRNAKLLKTQLPQILK
jgi:hypothetical protein